MKAPTAPFRRTTSSGWCCAGKSAICTGRSTDNALPDMTGSTSSTSFPKIKQSWWSSIKTRWAKAPYVWNKKGLLYKRHQHLVELKDNAGNYQWPEKVGSRVHRLNWRPRSNCRSMIDIIPAHRSRQENQPRFARNLARGCMCCGPISTTSTRWYLSEMPHSSIESNTDQVSQHKVD